VLSVDEDKNLDLLNNTIQNLRNSKNPQILSIYPSRELKKAFDLRIDYDLGEKWIV
jgi:DNA replication protein DnaC